MNELQLIEKIKVILGLIKEPVKMATATTEEGVNVTYEGDLVVGTPIFVVTDEGTVPAPAGIHILSDGTQIVLDENGVVTEITMPEEEQPAEESQEEMSEENNFQITPEEQTAIVAEVMQILEPRIVAIEEALMLISEQFKTSNTELMSKIEKLSAEPATQPTKTKKFYVEDKGNALKDYVNKIKK